MFRSSSNIFIELLKKIKKSMLLHVISSNLCDQLNLNEYKQ